MKVLLLFGSNSRNSGGLYNSVRSLGLSLLSMKEIEPEALAHDDQYSADDLPAYGALPIHNYRILGPSNFGYSPNIFKVVKSLRPEIIHPQCIWMYSSYVTHTYCRAFNIPYIISPRGMLDKWIVENNGWKKRLARFFFEDAHLKGAACIHALARSEYKSIRSLGLKNPVAIIPNGVNLPLHNESEAAIRPDWKEDSRKTLLFLSRLHPKKGLENLLNAWAVSDAIERGWKLAIAGEGKDDSYQASLEYLTSQLGIADNVCFIGPQFHQQKEICFRSVDAFILPSFSEGLPMVVLEAWSYKLPVLMTAACNLPEGFLKNAAIEIKSDPENMTRELNSFFAMSDDELKVMGLNGYRLVRDKFTWDSIAEQMTQVYRWMVHGGNPPDSVVFD